ncbi:MAG: YbaY family lipoprotein [Gammaproteobacteria bacterium]|nr:YbaY family lipoprotein [Gammaproteobacteria bacterium]
MRHIFRILVLIVAYSSMTSAAVAELKSMEVSISYRERIALPPDAQLDVQLIEVSRADVASGRIASQRFAMTSVPMAITLNYDSQVVAEQARYAIVASIWSGDEQIFRTARRFSVLDGSVAGTETETVEVQLTMVTEDDQISGPPRSIRGIQWAATEVAGQAWSNADPATLTIDDEMNFSSFGGCNRFSGQLILTESEINFPENFAGTLMTCPGQAEALERTYLDALRLVSRYLRYGGGLIMTDASGNALLHFEERPE